MRSFGEIGDAAGPGERRAGRVVDGDAGAPGLRRPAARRTTTSKSWVAVAGSRGASGSPFVTAVTRAAIAPRVSALRVELAAELGLDARQRLVVGRAEPAALERPARSGGDDGAEQPADNETSG